MLNMTSTLDSAQTEYVGRFDVPGLPMNFVVIKTLQLTYFKNIGILRGRVEGVNDCLIDQTDVDAMHWLVFYGGELIAAARQSVHVSFAELPDSFKGPWFVKRAFPRPIASLNRLVVDP